MSSLQKLSPFAHYKLIDQKLRQYCESRTEPDWSVEQVNLTVRKDEQLFLGIKLKKSNKNRSIQKTRSTDQPAVRPIVALFYSTGFGLQFLFRLQQLPDKVDLGFLGKNEKACYRIRLLQSAASHFTNQWNLPQIERERRREKVGAMTDK